MKNIYLLLIALFGLLLPGFSQITSTASGGNWSESTTWMGGTVPGAGDNVIISDGAVVIVDSDGAALSLSIGQGLSGTVQFDELTARTLTIGGDVIINNGAVFRSSVSGTITDHVLSLGGNLTNNSILDFSTNGNTAGAGIIFTGAGNALFGGTGVVTDVSAITIDKGTSAASVLELTPDNFSFQGSNSTAGSTASFLNILNGTFKISGTFTMDNGLFINTGAYDIPASGGLWLNNPNFIVNPRSGTLDVEGTLQVDAGTLNVGTASGERLGYFNGTVIIINGGAVNVASRFSATTTFGLNYTQTGGVFTVNTVANSSGTRASFDVQDNGDNSSFTMSGGTIVLQNPGISGSGPRDYLNQAANINITGGTLQVGNAATGTPQTFFVTGFAPGLVIDNAAGGHTVQLFGDFTAYGNTLLNTGTTLNLNDGATGFLFRQNGATFTNNGTLNGLLPASLFSFAGTSPQVYSGDGAISTLAGFEMNNTAGLTLATSIPSSITTSQLYLLAGDIITGVDTLTLGTSLTNLGSITYVSGTVVGKFKRWIDGVTGNTNFYVGIPGSTRTVSIDFTSQPAAGGTLTAEWLSLYPGANGLPLTEPGYPVLDSVAQDGYWRVAAADGLTGGIYTGTFTATNVVNVIDFSETVLLKRADNASPWTLDGTHVPTTGSNTTPILSRTGMSGFSEFGIGGKANVAILPVTIEYFRGSTKNAINLLDWKISCTGSPSVTMVLERSHDARKFYSITTISATDVRCLQPFGYADISPLAGINYYRIRITDADGRSTYSSVIALLNKKDGFDIVSVMPNPVQNIAILNVASSVNSNIEIIITDNSGRKVMVQTAMIIAGNNAIPINITNLSKGIYQINSYVNGESKTVRFLKN